jgi:hypothetical protein
MKMLKDEEYAQAHEVLEDTWKSLRQEGKKEQSNILKGLINGATFFELHRRGRSSAPRVWQTYVKYRPLIDEIDSLHANKYRECAALLESLYHKKITLPYAT